MKVCMRYHVAGRVQGVWYRAATQQMAVALEITGHAVNLPDGRVEVLACGERLKLAELERWLWQGPPAAQVERVDGEEVEFRAAEGFTKG